MRINVLSKTELLFEGRKFMIIGYLGPIKEDINRASQLIGNIIGTVSRNTSIRHATTKIPNQRLKTET